ncbi:hypothetical protein BKA81DRAFT_227838 [Phyllosticta paracitricarpa]
MSSASVPEAPPVVVTHLIGNFVARLLEPHGADSAEHVLPLTGQPCLDVDKLLLFDAALLVCFSIKIGPPHHSVPIPAARRIYEPMVLQVLQLVAAYALQQCRLQRFHVLLSIHPAVGRQVEDGQQLAACRCRRVRAEPGARHPPPNLGDGCWIVPLRGSAHRFFD